MPKQPAIVGDDLVLLQKLRGEGMSYRDLKRRFGVGLTAIQSAIKGPGWNKGPKPTIEEIVGRFLYDPETGEIRYRETGELARILKRKDDNYRFVQWRGRNIYVHRIAWALTHGTLDVAIDHIDRNPANNALRNLRPATPSQNMANRGPPKNSITKFNGVGFSERLGKWTATCSRGSVRRSSSVHATPEEAARAYDALAIELHGEFAVTNASLGLLSGQIQDKET